MIFSENLQGTGKRWMWKLNAQDRISCILEYYHNVVLSIMKNAIADRAIDEKTLVNISPAIYATKVVNFC